MTLSLVHSALMFIIPPSIVVITSICFHFRGQALLLCFWFCLSTRRQTMKCLAKHVLLSSQSPHLSLHPGWSARTTPTMRRFTYFSVRKTLTWAQKRTPGYQGLPEFVRYTLIYRRRHCWQRRSTNLSRLPQLIPTILFSSASVIKLIAMQIFFCGGSARLALIAVGLSSGKNSGRF